MSTQHTEETKEPWRALFTDLVSLDPQVARQAHTRFQGLRPWALPSEINEIHFYFYTLSLFGPNTCAPQLDAALTHSGEDRAEWLSAALRLIAIHGGNVSLLLKRGADPNLRIDDHTVLHRATQFGQLDVVRALVRANADVFAHNQNRSTPLDVAVHLNHRELIQFLQQAMRERTPPAFTLRAGKKRSRTTDSHSFSHPSDPCDFDPRTQLYVAIKKNRPDIISQLAANPDIGINMSDDRDYTPLLFAIYHNASFPVIQALLKAGADCSGEHFLRAIDLSITKARKDVLVLLLREQRTDSLPAVCTRALRSMILNNQSTMVPLLAPTLATIINTPDTQGYTPLLFAIEKKASLPVIQALLEAGADPRICSSEPSKPSKPSKPKFYSAIDLAVIHSRDNVACVVGEYLHNHFPDDLPDRWEKAAFLAVEQSNLFMLRFLASCNPDLADYQTEDDLSSLLHIATYYLSSDNGFEIFSYLLNTLNIDPHRYDSDRVSTLMLGCINGHVDAVHLMLCKAPNISDCFYIDLCFQPDKSHAFFGDSSTHDCMRLVLAADRNIPSSDVRATLPNFLIPKYGWPETLAEDVAQLRRMARDPHARRALPSDTPEILHLKDLAEKVAEIEAARGAEASAGHGR